MKKLSQIDVITILGILACAALILMFATGCAEQAGVADVVPAPTAFEKRMASEYEGTVVPAARLNRAERQGRAGAVKVFTPGSGRGSGCYVTYKGAHLVVTAAHVFDDSSANWVWIVRGDKKIKAHPVYFDKGEDIGLLATKPMDMVTPTKLNVRTPYPPIGEELTYSGYPGRHDLLTIRGEVVGYQKIWDEREKIVIHTYGWPGASGSCFFDKRGRMAGVLVAIPIGKGYVPQLLESMIFATPIKVLDLDKLDKHLCTLQPDIRPSFCSKK
jgi:hypothetical protein